MPPSRDQIADAVDALAKAQTRTEGKQIVEARCDELLAAAADEVFVDLLAQYEDNEYLIRNPAV